MTPSTRPGLSRERILDAADELLATGQPITMRAIAERLDVTAMSLYKWFANKDELLDALTTRRFTSPPTDIGTGSWMERVQRFVTSIRATLLEHLPLLQIDGAGRRVAAHTYRYADEGLRLVQEIGYRDQAAVDTYRVLFWTVLNHCLVIDAGGAMPGITAPHGIADQVVRIEGDDFAERMPTFAAQLPRFTAVEPDSFFEETMRVVLTGIAANAPGKT